MRLTTWMFRSREENARSPIAIAADSWHDAKTHAIRVLGTDAFEWEKTDAKPDVILHWEGSDAGTRPNRHLVIDDGEE